MINPNDTLDRTVAPSTSRIDEIADKFEEAWKLETPPAIEAFLEQVPTSDRRALLLELVMIDLECRWRYGASRDLSAGVSFDGDAVSISRVAARPRLGDYGGLFPELGCIDELPPEVLSHEQRVLERWSDVSTRCNGFYPACSSVSPDQDASALQGAENGPLSEAGARVNLDPTLTFSVRLSTSPTPRPLQCSITAMKCDAFAQGKRKLNL